MLSTNKDYYDITFRDIDDSNTQKYTINAMDKLP